MKLSNVTITLSERLPLAVVLFVLWVIINPNHTVPHIVLGAFLAYLCAWLSYHLLQGRLDPRLNLPMAFRLPVFALFFFRAVVIANWDVLKRVFASREGLCPRIIAFETILSSDIAKTTLANCITLTPGTVTVEVRDSEFFVHCLAPEHEEDLLGRRMERLVAWLFGDGPEEMRSLR